MSSGHGEVRVNMASEEIDIRPVTRVENQEMSDRDPTRMNQHVKVRSLHITEKVLAIM